MFTRARSAAFAPFFQTRTPETVESMDGDALEPAFAEEIAAAAPSRL
ncbi:hypothetical protein [Streptomyces sp. SS]|nr:hypothetical protein [Streptomyces sp. SS]